MAGITIQLISFDRQGSKAVPKFHAEALQRISQQYQTHKVAFISSCGAGKQGKSFILNFVLRSLQKQVEGEDDYLDWENPDQPLKGFAWTNREDKTTDGMWITTEPILMKNTKDEDVAVFLIDTQGIFDEYSTEEESNFILATCFLLSTTTLFSMKGEIHEDKIAAIANVLKSIRVKLPKFQLRGLMLLVKDWIVQQDYTHGEQGGSKYLTKRLAISPSHPHGPKHAREVFRYHAVNLNAFLFPYPGDKTVKPEFAGSLEEILPKFTKVLEAFLLSPNLLDLDTAKYTGAEALKIVADIIQAVSASYISSPSEPEVPSLEAPTQESLLGSSTNDIHLNVGSSPEQLVESLFANYTSQLNQVISANDEILELNAFNALHGQLRKSALTNYLPDKSNNFKECRVAEDVLKQRIDEFYVKTKSQIEMDRKSLEAELDSTAAETLIDYQEQLKNVPWIWTGNNISKNTSLQAKKIAEEAVEQFLKYTASFKKDVVMHKEQRLKNLLKEAFDKHSAEQKQKEDEKHDAQFDYKKFELLKEYNDEITKFLPGAENPLDIHNKYVKSKLATLEFARPCHSDQLKEAYMQEFQKLENKIQKDGQDDTPMEIDAVSSQLAIAKLSDEQDLPQPAVAQGSEPAILNFNKILQDANSLYTDEMTKFLQDVRSEEELEAFASTAQAKITKLIEAQFPNPLSSQGIKLEFLSKSNRDYSDLKAANLSNIRQKRFFVLETLKNEFKAKLSADQLVKTQAELESNYSELSNDLIRKLRNDEVSRLISIEEAEVEMRTWMDKQLETILKKLQIQQKEYDVQSQELQSELTSFYDDVMQKHFKNYPFTRPAEFLKFNGIIEKKAIDKFTKRFPDNDKKIREILNRLYQKYSEQNDMNTPGEPAIGIDLGTTYCCVAIYQHGKVDIIKNEIGKSTIPSYVALLPSGELIGENAKLQAHENPQSTIFDAKRLIGRKFHDKEVRDDVKLWPFKVVDEGDDIPKIEANGRKFPPEFISAKILKHIKNLAERYLKGTTVKNAVITVPAYFGDGQRQATKDAAEIAGLKVLQIINEPTAAAFAYHLHRNSTEKQNVLVYDLGGGTFDVSVLIMAGGKIQVKAVGGDTHLGGEDFDQALVNFCVQKFQKQHRINLAEGKNSLNEIENIQASRILRRLRNECEKRKMDLSSATSTTVNVASIIRNLDLVIPISRGDFEQMNMIKFNQTITVVQKALLDAKLRKEDIHEVVLVGGSTRIPKIQELLKTFFNGKELCKSVNADEAVAYGAAIQAAILNGTKEQKLQGISLTDVTPMSLGIKLFDGSLSIVIPRNTPVPAEITKNDYTTAIDNQTELTINIFEGEDKQRATNNNLLGSFLLKNIPRNKRGVEKISVTMKVNREGILHVSAVCVSNKSSGNIVIDEHKGRLTNSQIEEERKYLEAE